MKAHILVYPGYVNFEVVLAAYFFKSVGEVEIVGLSKEIVESAEGFPTKPHRQLSELTPDEVEAFIVPGGDPAVLEDHFELYDFLRVLEKRGCCIGAICAAPIHLARAGILDNRKYTASLPAEEMAGFTSGDYQDALAVADRGVVTAKPEGYVDFALALGKVMKIYKDEADYQETVEFFKNHRRV